MLAERVGVTAALNGLALAIVTGFMADARAGVRIGVAVNTPNVRIHADNDPSCHFCIDQDRRIQSRRYNRYDRYEAYEITRRDRMIARRMTWYTSVRLGKVMRLRRHGYSWFEIGQYLHMPRPVVRAAMHQKSWDRFLRQQRRHAKRHGKRRDRVTYYDGREYRKR